MYISSMDIILKSYLLVTDSDTNSKRLEDFILREAGKGDE